MGLEKKVYPPQEDLSMKKAWHAVIQRVTEEQAKCSDAVHIWPSGTQRHRNSCMYGELLRSQHQEAKAAQEEERLAIASGDVSKIKRVEREIKLEFKCACPLEILHLAVILPCCYTTVYVDLKETREGVDLTDTVQLILSPNNTTLMGSWVLCPMCYAIYALHEGRFTYVANGKDLGYHRKVERQWVGHLRPDQVEADLFLAGLR